MAIQVGANDGEKIDIKLQKIDSKTLELDKLDLTAKSNIGAKVTSIHTEAKGAVEADPDAEPPVEASPAVEASDVAIKLGEGQTVYQEMKDGKAVENSFIVKTEAADGTVSYNKATIDDEGAITKGDDFTPKTNDLPLEALDKALATVDSFRSDLGAIQNRFQSTINNLNNSVNNLSAARSRIQDADFATEVSNMSRGQILQQAGTAVLAQANQVPQGVLSLLR